MSTKDAMRRILDYSPLDILRFTKHALLSLRTVRKRGLDPSQEALLRLMREDNSRSRPPYLASKHWQEVARIFDEGFKTQGLDNPEEQSYNLRFSGFGPGDGRLHRYVCWLYYQMLKKRDSLELLRKLKPTCKVGPGYAYMMDDLVLSLDLLFSIDDFYSLYELDARVADGPIVVGELGAGWGRLGYVLCKVNPHCTYVVFDLPEVLLISQSYLPSLLHHRTVHRYEEAREHMRVTREILESANVWFLGPQHMERFDAASLDLVVNIGSFQEMPRDYIAHYMECFSKIAAGGTCFLRQLKSGKSAGHIYDEIESFEAYPVPIHWSVAFQRPTIFSDEFVEAGYRVGSQPPWDRRV